MLMRLSSTRANSVAEPAYDNVRTLARSGSALRRTSIRRKKDACIDDSVRGAVYQRGTHAQILLRITRVRTDYDLLAADGNLDIERRGGIGHDRSAPSSEYMPMRFMSF